MSINTEDLISSLLLIGYDKVDCELFTDAKAIVAADSKFKFEDYSIRKIFNSYIDFDGIFFKLKEGLSLSATQSNHSLNAILNRNSELTNYLISEGFGMVETDDKPKTKALVMKTSK